MFLLMICLPSCLPASQCVYLEVSQLNSTYTRSNNNNNIINGKVAVVVVVAVM